MARVSAEALEQHIQLNVANLTAELAKQKQIDVARKALNDFLSKQEIKPEVTILVDGVVSSSENNVKPFGRIEYVIHWLPNIGKFALETAKSISPVESGRYKKSWFLLYNNAEVNENSIPVGAKVLVLTNDQPYARKIERRGARLKGVPPGIVERIRQLILRKYKSLVDVNITYLHLGGGYKLKNPIHRKGKTQSDLTYPALIITSKF